MKRQLLLVEDNHALNTMLGWQLSDHDWTVEAAHSCAEALTLAGRTLPDVVVLDYHLPDGDGIALFRQLAALRPGLQGVMMSGDHRVSLERSKVAGLYGVLRKPLHFPALLGQLQRLRATAKRTPSPPLQADRLST